MLSCRLDAEFSPHQCLISHHAPPIRSPPQPANNVFQLTLFEIELRPRVCRRLVGYVASSNLMYGKKHSDPPSGITAPIFFSSLHTYISFVCVNVLFFHSIYYYEFVFFGRDRYSRSLFSPFFITLSRVHFSTLSTKNLLEMKFQTLRTPDIFFVLKYFDNFEVFSIIKNNQCLTRDGTPRTYFSI